MFKIYFFALVIWGSSFCFAQTFIVMRHGEAKQNVAQILNSDVANSQKFTLTPKGEQQVHDAAKSLKTKLGVEASTLVAIYVSPLRRTRQTAEMLAKDLGIDSSHIVVDDRLRENGMGRMEGHHESELDALDVGPGGYLARAKSFGGETRDEVVARLKDFLAKIKSASQGKIIVVTHGTPAAELLKLLDPHSKNQKELDRGEFRVVELKTGDPNSEFERTR